MTPNQKEELRKEYLQWAEVPLDDSLDIPDWFYSKLEEKEKEIEQLQTRLLNKQEQAMVMMKTIQSQTEEIADIESHYSSVGMGLYPKKVYEEIERLQSEVNDRDESINALREIVRLNQQANRILGEEIEALKQALRCIQPILKSHGYHTTNEEIEQLLK
jgi:predicted  nucleic acid-binding Zn-ribbon protein